MTSGNYNFDLSGMNLNQLNMLKKQINNQVHGYNEIEVTTNDLRLQLEKDKTDLSALDTDSNHTIDAQELINSGLFKFDMLPAKPPEIKPLDSNYTELLMELPRELAAAFPVPRGHTIQLERYIADSASGTSFYFIEERDESGKVVKQTMLKETTNSKGETTRHLITEKNPNPNYKEGSSRPKFLYYEQTDLNTGEIKIMTRDAGGLATLTTIDKNGERTITENYKDNKPTNRTVSITRHTTEVYDQETGKWKKQKASKEE